MKNNFKIVLIFLLLTLFFACNRSNTNTNLKKLPLDTVATIITECYFIESKIYVKKINYNKEYTLALYDSIFNKHNINKDIFMYNVNYYFTHKKQAEKLMNKVDEMVEQHVTALRDSLNNSI